VDTTQRTPLRAKPDITSAHEAHLCNAALRLAGDPAQLARAARIVRAAIQTGKLTPADLDGPIVQAAP
jgi:hypothetical protein